MAAQLAHQSRPARQPREPRPARRSPWDTPRVLTLSRETWEPWMAACYFCETCGCFLSLGAEPAAGHRMVAVRCVREGEQED